MRNDELEMIWNEAVAAYPGIRLEGLEKTKKKFSQDSRCLGRDSNRVPPE
jgi:hypothetical protein